MNAKVDALINSLAALLVLFSAMLDPRVSVAVAVVSLLGLSAYRLLRPGAAPD